MSFALEREGDLARHVYNALEDEAAQPLRPVQERAPEGCYFSELEISLSEWSFGYGVAWALARIHEPFASSRRLAELAEAATRSAWRAFGDDSWTALLAEDRERRGPVEAAAVEEPLPQSQLDDFMGKVARTRPRRRPPRGGVGGPGELS